jgi:hypothetical protein
MFTCLTLSMQTTMSGYTYSKVPRYKEFSRLALKEMFRQTGPELAFDEKRGVAAVDL